MSQSEEFALQLYHAPPSDEEQRKFWAEQFKNQLLTPDDTFTDRIKVCYRLTRALAYWKGIVTPNQTLAEGTDIHPNPWYEETTYLANHAPPARMKQMLQVQQVPMSLQPPPKTNQPEQIYKETRDRRLRRWLQLMSRIARRLNLGATESGRRGLRWLLEPESVRQMWIQPEVLMAWETVLLGEFLDEQLDKGVHEGQIEVRKKYGLSAHEGRVLGDLARIAAPDIASDNLETKKALMELRIDKFMRRAREEGDLRAELQGLKLLAIVQGLNKVEPDDDLKGMIEVVAEVSSKESEDVDVEES